MTPPGATVGYLPQEPERRPGETVRAYLARRTGVAAAELALDAASAALAEQTPGADDTYADALERYLALGAADFDARLGAVCADLGLPTRVLDLEMPALSGGQAAGRASPRSCSRASTCSCSTSRRTTSTSPDSSASNGSCTTS